MVTATREYRIYAACLASYNNGDLHGRWIDCEGKDADELGEEIAAMLRESKYPNVMVDCPDCAGEDCQRCKGAGSVASAEEFAIHDFEGFPRDSVGEYTNVNEIAALMEAIESHDDEEAFLAALSYADDLEQAASMMEDGYRGQWPRFQDYAEQFAEDVGELSGMPEHLQRYIDWEAYARDMEHDYTCIDAPDYGGVFVFQDC